MILGRRDALRVFGLGSAAALPGAAARPGGASSGGQGVEGGTAIQGVCAWPNLQLLPDGTIVGLIFNQPCHGLWEGDLECWASEDGGVTWRRRGTAAAHQAGTNRMNCAAGLAANGDLVALCGGWPDRGRPGEPSPALGVPLRPWVCRSADGGKTWSAGQGFPAPPADGIGRGNELIPFGNLRRGRDGSLRAAAYLRRGDRRSCYLLRSRDDGRTWAEASALHPGGNETDILHLGEGRWLAACREFRERRDVHLELFSSEDDGRSWSREMPLSLPRQVTGHLTRLRDGRVLLSYGNRCWSNFGVEIRLSDDEGATWSPPMRLADCPRGDCGYPSTIQREDGIAVTAYYTQVSDDYHYEMRVVRWDPSEFTREGTWNPREG